MRPADKAWLTLGVGVVAWDVFGPETLSQATGRYKVMRPAVTGAVIFYVAAHLMELIPKRIDVLSVLGKNFRGKPQGSSSNGII
jgi:hypothetical protein